MKEISVPAHVSFNLQIGITGIADKMKNAFSDKTGNILVTTYFFLAGMFTLNYLESSVATNASGVAFILAGMYGIVAIFKNSKYLF